MKEPFFWGQANEKVPFQGTIVEKASRKGTLSRGYCYITMDTHRRARTLLRDCYITMDTHRRARTLLRDCYNSWILTEEREPSLGDHYNSQK